MSTNKNSYLPGATVHLNKIRVLDEPLVVKGDLDVERQGVSQHVVPLVNIHGRDLVCHDLIEKSLLRTSALVAIIFALLKWSINEFLDEDNVLLSQSVLLKCRHQLIVINQVLKNLDGGLLVRPATAQPIRD